MARAWERGQNCNLDAVLRMGRQHYTGTVGEIKYEYIAVELWMIEGDCQSHLNI